MVICMCLQEQRFPEFVRSFLKDMYPAGDVPKWVREAMEVAGIDLTGVATAPVEDTAKGAAEDMADG